MVYFKINLFIFYFKLLYIFINNKNNLRDFIKFNSPKLKTNIVFFFTSVSFLNLLLIAIYTFGKSIVYEDSFVLLYPGKINFISWLFKPHNGHIIFLSKLVTNIFSFFYLNPTGYNIIISILILLTGIFVIKEIIYNILENKCFKNLIFYYCTFIWISPFQWENLIWEFQFPWFLISLLVLILTLINLYDLKDKAYNQNYKKIFFLFSPIIAVLSSGQGICYVFCLLITFIIQSKRNIFALIGVTISILIFFNFRENSLIINKVDIFDGIKYLFLISSSIFKPSISSFNRESIQSWYLPLISSFLFNVNSIYFLFRNYKFKFNKHIFSKNILIITPIIFGLQFSFLTTISRSQFGYHQGLVSRYFTSLSLIPIGLLILASYIYSSLSNYYEISNENKKSKENLFQFTIYANIITFLIIINCHSIFKTIYETKITYNYRQRNFAEFIKICKKNENQEIKNDSQLKKYFENLIIAPSVNKPPLPKANNFYDFKNYLRDDFCKLTTAYFE